MPFGLVWGFCLKSCLAKAGSSGQVRAGCGGAGRAAPLGTRAALKDLAWPEGWSPLPFAGLEFRGALAVSFY